MTAKLLGVSPLLGLLLLTACGEGPVLMNEEYLTLEGEDERYMGGACMGTEEGGGMGGGTAPGAFGAAGSASVEQGYSYSYEARGNAVSFRFATHDGEVVAERTYDQSFIASGRRDVVKVEAYGRTLRFVNWGAPECQPIREPDAD
jgi:hypothetical protein